MDRSEHVLMKAAEAEASADQARDQHIQFHYREIAKQWMILARRAGYAPRESSRHHGPDEPGDEA
jgi:hypothetical protein